jgi:small nuclear ribonucleoprotein (snRNP)-like protein
MKSLVDSRKVVTVILKDGEILRGRVRYYDRDCFSVRQAGGSRKFFLRKTDVSSILLE